MAIRETQVYVEAVVAPGTRNARETQVYAEAIIAPPAPPMRVTQCYLEAIIANVSASGGQQLRVFGCIG